MVSFDQYLINIATKVVALCSVCKLPSNEHQYSFTSMSLIIVGLLAHVTYSLVGLHAVRNAGQLK